MHGTPLNAKLHPKDSSEETLMPGRFARRALVVGAMLGIIILAGTVGFVLIEGYSWFDAFYMTLITMTTVGYDEIHPLSQSGRIFNSFLIAFGVTTIFIAIGAMTQTII